MISSVRGSDGDVGGTARATTRPSAERMSNASRAGRRAMHLHEAVEHVALALEFALHLREATLRVVAGARGGLARPAAPVVELAAQRLAPGRETLGLGFRRTREPLALGADAGLGVGHLLAQLAHARVLRQQHVVLAIDLELERGQRFGLHPQRRDLGERGRIDRATGADRLADQTGAADVLVLLAAQLREFALDLAERRRRQTGGIERRQAEARALDGDALGERRHLLTQLLDGALAMQDGAPVALDLGRPGVRACAPRRRSRRRPRCPPSAT